MKGILAERYPSNDGEYSNLRVLKSAAGYYLGTIFTHNETSEFPGMVEPGSRESEYFPTREAAEKALEQEEWEQRDNP